MISYVLLACLANIKLATFQVCCQTPLADQGAQSSAFATAGSQTSEATGPQSDQGRYNGRKLWNLLQASSPFGSLGADFNNRFPGASSWRPWVQPVPGLGINFPSPINQPFDSSLSRRPWNAIDRQPWDNSLNSIDQRPWDPLDRRGSSWDPIDPLAAPLFPPPVPPYPGLPSARILPPPPIDGGFLGGGYGGAGVPPPFLGGPDSNLLTLPSARFGTGSFASPQVITLMSGRMIRLPNGENDWQASVTLVRDSSDILVDTGFSADTAELIRELARYGLRPEDIDVVVTTSGRPDHTGNLNLFSRRPHLFDQYEYIGHRFTETPLKLSNSRKLTLNTEVWRTPGHGQNDNSLIVRNVPGNGTVAIVGDLIPSEEFLLNAYSYPTDMIWNRNLQLENLNAVICVADVIVPGHGSSFWVRGEYKRKANCGPETASRFGWGATYPYTTGRRSSSTFLPNQAQQQQQQQAK